MTACVRSWALSVLLPVIGCSHSSISPAKTSPVGAAFGKVPGRPDARTWFRPERESEIVALEAGVAGDRVATLVDVPESACAVFIARGTSTIEDLDLAAYGEDGAVLGMDEGTDKTPALLVCPPHPARIYVAARIASGHGLVAVGAERLPPKDAERARITYQVRQPTDDADARSSAWPGLSERIADHRARLGGRWTDVRRVAIPLDARTATRVSATVTENTCLNALVLASAELSHLELSALDESGHILGRSTAFGHDRSLVVCASLGERVGFEVRPLDGRGVALLVLSESEPGAASALDDIVRIERYPSGTLDDERRKHEARLSGVSYPAVQVVKSGLLEPGRMKSTSFSLPKGCSRIDILTAAPVRDVRVRLWGADDSLMAEDDGTAAPALFACSPGGPVRLDLESLSRPGPYSIELRVERDSPPLLQGSSLSASRLLGHLFERGLIASAAGVGKVTQRDLTPEHLATEPILVPLQRCVDVTLALGASSTGAEVRLVDAASGEELALGRGTTVASARACAIGPGSGGTINARAEFRVRAGQGQALSTTHLSTPAP